jgi:hypothetical protein
MLPLPTSATGEVDGNDGGAGVNGGGGGGGGGGGSGGGGGGGGGGSGVVGVSGASPASIGASSYAFTHVDGNLKHSMACSDPMRGGFGKVPRAFPDVLHSYYGLAGLSIMGELLRADGDETDGFVGGTGEGDDTDNDKKAAATEATGAAASASAAADNNKKKKMFEWTGAGSLSDAAELAQNVALTRREVRRLAPLDVALGVTRRSLLATTPVWWSSTSPDASDKS